MLFLPTRFWTKNTPPLLSMIIINEIIINKGDNIINPASEKNMSNNLFKSFPFR